jgi:hypothetical protein
MKNLFKKIAILSILMIVFGCSKDDAPAEVVKTKVKITGYKIDNFSFVASGGLGWDGVNGLPDVYVGLFNGTSLIYRSNTINNVPQSGLPLSESFNSPYYLVPSFSNTINIVVMDDDINDFPSNSDDEIGYVPFIMNDYTTGNNKYPATVTKTANGVTVTLSLTWE